MKISPWPQANRLLNDIFIFFISMDNMTNSRIDQSQFRVSSGWIVLVVHITEDLSLSEKGVAFTCTFAPIVFANINHCYIPLSFISWEGGENIQKCMLSHTISLSKQTNKIIYVCFENSEWPREGYELSLNKKIHLWLLLAGIMAFRKERFLQK